MNSIVVLVGILGIAIGGMALIVFWAAMWRRSEQLREARDAIGMCPGPEELERLGWPEPRDLMIARLREHYEQKGKAPPKCLIGYYPELWS